MKIFALTLLVFSLITSAVLAQGNPTVEIALSQPTAQLGETITAEVYVRNATNVGGLDIGIRVDDQCLRIVDRQPGGYLPTTEAEGAFSALSELNPYNTRLAAALTDRTKHASGDGVFYRVQLEVTCAEGTASLDFAYAQVSVYADPAAEIIDVISYDLDKGTLNHINAQLTVVPGSAQESPATTVPDQTAEDTTPAQETSAAQNPTSMIVLVGLLALGIFFLGLIFWLMRRTARSEDEIE